MQVIQWIVTCSIKVIIFSILREIIRVNATRRIRYLLLLLKYNYKKYLSTIYFYYLEEFGKDYFSSSAGCLRPCILKDWYARAYDLSSLMYWIGKLAHPVHQLILIFLRQELQAWDTLMLQYKQVLHLTSRHKLA